MKAAVQSQYEALLKEIRAGGLYKNERVLAYHTAVTAATGSPGTLNTSR